MRCPDCNARIVKCEVCGSFAHYDRQRTLKGPRKAEYFRCSCGAEMVVKHPKYEEGSSDNIDNQTSKTLEEKR